jgi:hypothetical protein
VFSYTQEIDVFRHGSLEAITTNVSELLCYFFRFLTCLLWSNKQITRSGNKVHAENVLEYVACSKSIWHDFFPRKLMKHGMCAVVGRWREPSCAYVDSFLPADSVSRVQPACEWECICNTRNIESRDDIIHNGQAVLRSQRGIPEMLRKMVEPLGEVCSVTRRLDR